MINVKFTIQCEVLVTTGAKYTIWAVFLDEGFQTILDQNVGYGINLS